MRHRFVLLAALVAGLAASAPAGAKTFRWSSAADLSSWDIHAQNVSFQSGIHAAVYESLVYYNSKTFKIEPLLATAWSHPSPVQTRFSLRQGVKFHDGSPLTADDVVFSLNRAMAKTSNFTPYVQGIERIVKVDERTVDVFTKGPNPVLLNQLTELRIMNRRWAEKNQSVEPKDIRNVNQETFANRHAMGTGPFMLRQWVPDQRLVLVANPHWWGQREGNVTEIVYTPVKSDATRVAALLSGDIDLLLDPSPQDLPRLRQAPGLRVLDGVENRTIFFGMDQFSDELPGSDIKGRRGPAAQQRHPLAHPLAQPGHSLGHEEEHRSRAPRRQPHRLAAHQGPLRGRVAVPR